MLRRGLSDIVTTILIILVVLVAVTIIWNVALPLMEKASGLDAQAYTTKLAVMADSVSYDPNTNSVSFNIARDAGDGDIAGFMVGLTDPAGNVKTFRQNFTIAEYEAKNFQLNYTDLSIDDVLSVTITPIFRQNGTNKETFGLPIEQPVKNKTAFKLPSGLVTRWKFESGLSDDYNNWIFTPGVGSAASAPYNSQSKFGSSSANFPGAPGDYMTFIDTNNTFTQQAFTVVAWIRPQSSLTNLENIFGTSASSSGFKLKYQGASGGWNMTTVTSSAPTIPASIDNNWHFIAGTYYYATNPGNISLFYDTSITSSQVYSSMAPASTLKIGGLYSGQIDELLFFSRNLSASEINDIRRKYKG